MFDQLHEISARPAPFAHYTAAELWTDDHTSQQMLKCHLDESVDLSSRNKAFIERSAAFIEARFALGAGKRVADFGCGPGLYTTRLAATGAEVTGIDFSARSIQYAQKLARRQGLSIDHVQADYLEFETEKRFDLITMIMCDFCALSPSQRKIILEKFCTLLAPGGSLLLDVYSLSAFEQRQETTTYSLDLLDGFWAADPYYGFLNTFKYDKDKVILDKYAIIEKDRVRTVYNWLQYFDRAALKREIQNAGLKVKEFLGDVAGTEFDPESEEFAVIGTKPE
jgi:SAM-dependent methyltransferase